MRMPTKTPKIISDLYADLRDRRLLPVLAAILVGIVAIPFVLRSDVTEVPAAAPYVAPEGATAAEPAVQLTSNPALRDYRKRLDHLESKDPFAIQEEVADAGEDLISSLEESPPGSGGETPPSSDPPASPPPDLTIPDPAPVDDPVSTPPPPPTETTPDTTGGTSTPPESTGDSYVLDDGTTLTLTDQYFAYRADVLFGRKDELKELTIDSADTLLDEKTEPRRTPIATFLTADPEGEKATFFVFFDSSSTRGDGHCLPRPSECEQLTLKVGDDHKFIHWNHHLYELELEALNLALFDADGKVLDEDVTD